MSFIYARNLKNKVYVFADSKLSVTPKDEAQLIKILGKKSYINIRTLGVIKNVIIDEKICIASAGVLEDFNAILKKIDLNKNYDVHEICKYALDIHLKKDMRTDFIIALSDCNNSKLFEIKNGEVNEVQSSWLGSYECFKKFQIIKHDDEVVGKLTGYMDEEMKAEFSEETIDSYAFKETVNAKIDETVGGYIIECFGKNGEFRYNEQISTYTEKAHPVSSDGIVKIYDNVFDGGYTYHVFQSKTNYMIYISQLEKGIIYEPHIEDKNYDYLRFPKLYNVSEQEFLTIIGIESTGLMLI